MLTAKKRHLALRSEGEREKAGYEEQPIVTTSSTALICLQDGRTKNAAILRLVWRRALSMKMGELKVSLLQNPNPRLTHLLFSRGKAFPPAGAAVAGTPLLRGDPATLL